MPSMVPPKRATDYVFYVGLFSQADPRLLQANPTLAPGDVRIAIDDGVPNNLAVLPVVDVDFTKRVKVSLSAEEMTGDNISIIFSDALGAEWCDQIVNLQTVEYQFDDIGEDTSENLPDDIFMIAGFFAWLLFDMYNEVEEIGVHRNENLDNFMFLLIASADHVTPITGCAVLAEFSLDGGAFAACANPVTEMSAGMYKIDLADTDLDGDAVCLKFSAPGADTRFITIKTHL